VNKSRIEWTTWTWNPIKGLCPVGCWYCYARKIYRRFGWRTDIHYEIDDLKILFDLKGKELSKIFVCSTIEIFHPLVKKEWRDNIFSIIESHPQHTFQILTKMPENIDRPMPDNVWLGVSITKNGDEWKTDHLFNSYGESSVDSKIFISLEPMLDNCKDIVYSLDDINWLIIGKLTGHGKKHDPEREWVEFLVKEARVSGIPIFLKDNLKEIWGEPLIQEYPKEGL